MRKAVVAALSGAAILAGGLAAPGVNAFPHGGEGCVATSPGQAVSGVASVGRCSYTATRPGEYAAAGENWTITVSRIIGGRKQVTKQYRGSAASGPSPACQFGAFKQGDIVDVTVTNGTVFVGDAQPGRLGQDPVTVGLGVRLDNICPA